MIERGLINRLLADANVTGLAGTRVYLNRAREGAAFPNVVLTRIDSPRVQSMAGPSGLAHPRIQIDSRAQNPTDARQLADYIRKSLDGYKGYLPPNFTVQGCHLETEHDAPDDPFNADDTATFRMIQDFTVWWEEA